jgi:site-specific recombinase XerC
MVWRQRRVNRRPEPDTLLRKHRSYPVAYEQLTLMHMARDLSRALTEPPVPDFALFLEEAAKDHACRHGWSKTRTTTTRQGLRILASIQDTPGALIKASDVELLSPAAFNRQPILDVLNAVGLLQDDRMPSIVAWFSRKIASLPEAMATEFEVWFNVLLRGSTTAPRAKARAYATIKARVRSAVPAAALWAASGRASLREITREDIDSALPDQGSERALTGTALRSLFRTLKARRLVFVNPTTHTKTGRPESRIPLPINEGPVRAALDSDNPARAALATLIGYHGLRNEEVRALQLTDVRDGKIHLPDRRIPLAPPVRESLSAWLDHRTAQWPETLNPHLFISKQSAVRSTQVSNVWVLENLGLSPQALREDRILYEALTTKDLRRLCDLFGLSVRGAERYMTAATEPEH